MRKIAYKAAETIQDQFEGDKLEIREQIRYAENDFEEAGYEVFGLTKDEEIKYTAKKQSTILRGWLL